MRTLFVKISCLLLLVHGVTAAQVKNGILHLTSPVDTAQHFSVYFPEGYREADKIPLVIFLDPAARADLPLTLYRELADKYGVALAASSNSRNFNWQATMQSVETIYNQLLPVMDTAMVILSGFSGGSRAAATLATQNEIFSGVIGCGAGFSEFKLEANHTIPYAGIVGWKDMNFSEMLGVQQYLDKIGNRNLLLLFDGGHDWPPKNCFDRALAWQLAPKKKTVTADALPSWIKEIGASKDSGMIYLSYLQALQLSHFDAFHLQGDSTAGQLMAARDFAKDKKRFEQSIREEEIYTKAFLTSFLQVKEYTDIYSVFASDWTEKIGQVRQMMKSSDPYLRLAGIRCKDKSIRMCAEFASQLLSTKDFVPAYNLARIMGFFFPESGSPLFMMAKAAAGLGDKTQALECLSKLSHLNFDMARVTNDPILQTLFTKSELESLLRNSK